MSDLRDLVALLRADTALLVIETPDEPRVVRFDCDLLAEASDGFSGAEIEQAVVSGLYAAHAEQRAPDTALLHEGIAGTRPLSVLMAEQVDALRAWARPRTVSAD